MSDRPESKTAVRKVIEDIEARKQARANK